jgi:hypothetical protein
VVIASLLSPSVAGATSVRRDYPGPPPAFNGGPAQPSRSGRSRVEVSGHAPIDLVSLNDASIVLAWEVVDRGVCLFARDHDVETDFVTRAHARYWDFKPFREAQWRLAGERAAARSSGP